MLKSRHTVAVSLALLVSLFALAPALQAQGTKKADHRDQPKVNVNTADASTLALLPRVGPSLAHRILEFRKKNGPFKKVDDLLLVHGIGERSLALLEPYVTTDGKTTLKQKVHTSRHAAGARP